MVAFAIFTHVERIAPRRFLARARAIPARVGERCAPEERCVHCASEAAAAVAAQRLARELAADVLARGNSLVPEGSFVSRPRPVALSQAAMSKD